MVLDPASGSRKHADARVEFRFRCSNAAALTSIDLLLFDHHPRIQRIEVQIATARGQHKQVLRRGAAKRVVLKR